MSKKMLIVDGFSVFFRAYFGLPTTMKLKDGRPINAVYGFASMLFSSIEQFQPDYVCVCFDRKEPTFRHASYPEYKAHRPEPPEDFVEQIPTWKELLLALNLPKVDKAGFEADDVMGTLAHMAEKENIHSILLTGDKDSWQLITDKVSVAMSKKGVSEMVIVSEAEVKERFNLAPNQIIDLKALMGDSSDNIPGVKGIGEKTAIKLLTDYTNLENIYQNLENIESKSVKEKLINGKEMAYVSKNLATICTTVPITEVIEDLKFDPDWEHILKAFNEFEFKQLVSKYSKHIKGDTQEFTESLETTTSSDGKYTAITTTDELKKILPHLQNGFAIDLETTSLRIRDAEIVGVALSYKEKIGFYIPFNEFLSNVNEDTTTQTGLFDIPVEEPKEITTRFLGNPLLDCLKPLLEDESIPKYTHNGKYEYAVLRNYEIELNGITFDSLLAAYLLYPGERLGLKALTERLLNIKMTSYEDVAGKGKEQIRFDEVEIKEATQYAAADADFTLRLKELLFPKLKEKGLFDLFKNIELPSMLVLAKVERNGVRLNSDYLASLEKEFTDRTLNLQNEIYTISNSSFNLNSTQQLATVLFDQLGLPVIKKTKTGRSTDSSVLEKLKDLHPIAKYIVEYRLLEKLQSTYIKSLPKLVNKTTKKIHASFNQTVAITGRLSSADPNLQNIPIRSIEGSKIRGAFIPSDENSWILSADYSQIELRILAHLSQDPTMLNAFKNGEDIHKATASLVFNKPLEEVTKDERYRAKAVNFGIIYGQSAFGLSEQLGISRSEAKEIIDSYYEHFSKIREFMDKTVEETKVKGYVETEFGRRRDIADINSSNKMKQAFAERIAINTRMQGTAADIIKIAMISIQKEIEKQNLKSLMIIQVHDELVFDVPTEEKEIMKELVKNGMESAVKFSVPLSVDVDFGKTWQEIE